MVFEAIVKIFVHDVAIGSLWSGDGGRGGQRGHGHISDSLALPSPPSLSWPLDVYGGSFVIPPVNAVVVPMISVERGVPAGRRSELLMRVVYIEYARFEGLEPSQALVPAMPRVLLDYVVPSL